MHRRFADDDERRATNSNNTLYLVDDSKIRRHRWRPLPTRLRRLICVVLAFSALLYLLIILTRRFALLYASELSTRTRVSFPNGLGSSVIERPKHRLSTVDEGNSTILIITRLTESNLQRRIDPMAEIDQNVVTNDPVVPYRYWHEVELETSSVSCKSPHWSFAHFSTCNSFHEMDLGQDTSRTQDYDSFYINSGYYRDVWVVSKAATNSRFVLKMSRIDRDLEDYKSLYMVNREATIMERLTKEPLIMNIHGYCGTSIAVEALSYELEKYAVPGSGYRHGDRLLGSLNKFTPSEKLEIALEMARAIAILHGHPMGVIVHDDIQLQQWLRSSEGVLKLGDFNRAQVLEVDTAKQSYCKFNNGQGFGNNRAPEEYEAGDLDEKIDVYSYGNCLYSLLTGLWVFYDNEDDTVVQSKVMDGERPRIDPIFKDSSPEAELAKIIEACWQADSSKRIDMFEVVSRLEDVMQKNKELPVPSPSQNHQS